MIKVRYKDGHEEEVGEKVTDALIADNGVRYALYNTDQNSVGMFSNVVDLGGVKDEFVEFAEYVVLDKELASEYGEGKTDIPVEGLKLNEIVSSNQKQKKFGSARATLKTIKLPKTIKKIWNFTTILGVNTIILDPKTRGTFELSGSLVGSNLENMIIPDGVRLDLNEQANFGGNTSARHDFFKFLSPDTLTSWYRACDLKEILHGMRPANGKAMSSPPVPSMILYMRQMMAAMNLKELKTSMDILKLMAITEPNS